MSLRAFRVAQTAYRRVFVEAHGPFPHPCYFCGEAVGLWSGRLDSAAPVVHHVDHDRANDAPENLVPAHHGCHVRYHQTGRTVSSETRARLVAAATGKRPSPDVRAKLSAAKRGGRLTAEHRAKISATLGEPEVRGRMSAAKKGKPLSPEHRAKLSAALKAAPRASCVACRREYSVIWLTRHLHVCSARTTD